MKCQAGNRRRAFRAFGSPDAAIAASPHHSLIRSCQFFTCRQSGFTLIELLVVLSIIMVLASMGLVQYRNSIAHAKEAVLKEDLFLMRDAIDQYYADKGQYPGSLDALASDGYLRSIPKDPITNSVSTWQSVPAEPNPNNPTAEPGVFDVKSGSDRTALDGSKYADW